MRVEKRQVYAKYGQGLKEYPFCFAELFDQANVSLGSGFIPDGHITVLLTAPRDEDSGHMCFNPVIDPSFLNTKELATGIMAQRGQWY